MYYTCNIYNVCSTSGTVCPVEWDIKTRAPGGGVAPVRRVDARVSASRVDDAGADSDDGIVQGGR